MMSELSQLTDKVLRLKLKELGYGVGPITDATRATYRQKLLAAVNGEPAPPGRRAKASTTSSHSETVDGSEVRATSVPIPSHPAGVAENKEGRTRGRKNTAADVEVAEASAVIVPAAAAVPDEDRVDTPDGPEIEDDISNLDETTTTDDDEVDDERANFMSVYPGREQEFEAVYAFTRSALIHEKGCAYVSGVPGTGKTATIRQVVAALKHERNRDRRRKEQQRNVAGSKAAGKERRLQRAESEKSDSGNGVADDNNTLPNFVHVEVNGMRMLDAKQLYVRLYQGLMKAQGFEVSDQLAPSTAEKYIADLFGANMVTLLNDGGNSGVTTPPMPPTIKSTKPVISKSKLRSAADNRKVVLLVVDELDAFKTARQEIFYKLFEYSQYAQNKFVVITIANTMDLDERHFSARVASRLAMSKFQFQPYTHEQLTTICQHWLQNDLKARHGHAEFSTEAVDAFRLAARKVANLSGDARRVVQICKRALELAEEEAPQVDDDDDDDDEDSRPSAPHFLTVHHINAACEEMFKSPKFAYLRSGVTPMERVFLEAYLDVVGGAGVRDYATVGDVYKQMVVRIRLVGGNVNGGGGGGGDARGPRTRGAAKQQQQTPDTVIDERLVRFQAAETAMKNLLTFGILQESAGDGSAAPGDAAGIRPRFFMLTMSTADARRALEMNTAAN